MNAFCKFVMSGVVQPSVQTVAFASTVTPDCDKYNIVNVGALTAAITIANPTGTPADGDVLSFRLQQDGTGGRAITWGTQYAFGTDFPAANIPTTASAKYELTFRWNATDSKWRCLGGSRGF